MREQLAHAQIESGDPRVRTSGRLNLEISLEWWSIFYCWSAVRGMLHHSKAMRENGSRSPANTTVAQTMKYKETL